MVLEKVAKIPKYDVSPPPDMNNEIYILAAYQ